MTHKPARWFLPKSPDVIGMLVHQAEITARGMGDFAAWAAGDAEASVRVRAAEHEADKAKTALRIAVTEAFTTPLEPEDLYELSSDLDEVLNSAKNLVRESEAILIPPDRTVADMASIAAEGIELLVEAFSAIGKPRTNGEAAISAEQAVKRQRRLEPVYRAAMGELLKSDELRIVTGYQELYRRMMGIGDGIIRVAERVGYSVVKES